MRQAWFVAAALLLAGCSSLSPANYVSPRVTGRVVDAQTHQPLPGVMVKRLTSDTTTAQPAMTGGGHLLQNASAVRTGKDGLFVVPSMRALGPLGGTGWSSVSLAFDLRGYETLTRSYNLAQSTNTLSVEPLVEAGEVPLIQMVR